MAANEDALGKLHEALATVLIEAIKGTELPGYIDPDTEEEVPPQTMLASAAIMTVAAKFLKDNGITCAPSADNEMGELEAIMKRRQNSLRGVDKTDIAGIRADSQFLGSA